MEIVLNGRSRVVQAGQSLASLVAELGFDPAHLAIEYNGRVLEPTELGEISLSHGDTLELVRFVGGG